MRALIRRLLGRPWKRKQVYADFKAVMRDSQYRRRNR